MALTGYVLGPVALGLGATNLSGGSRPFIATAPAIGLIILHFALIALGVGGTIAGSTSAGRTNTLKRALVRERDALQRELIRPTSAPTGFQLGTF